MQRFHSLDALRAVMMLLGIYLHAAVAHSVVGGWPIKDPRPTHVFDITIGIIHAFRMPVFFCMAGFFAALLHSRRGVAGYLRNRALRVAVPFVIFWALTFPLVCYLSAAYSMWGKPDALVKAGLFIVSGGFLAYAHPMHLWFLLYLVVLYAISWPIVAVAGRLLPAAASRWFRAAVSSRWFPLLLAPIYAATLCFHRFGFLDDPPSFIPQPQIVASYLVVFLFGWALYHHSDLLPAFERHIVPSFTGLTVLLAAWFLWIEPTWSKIPQWRLITACGNGLAMCLFLAALIGLFVRHASRPIPVMRYLSDASYWLYIAHMLVLMALQIALRPLAIPAVPKAFLCLALAIPILLASYHYLVRSTVVGELLNGRRVSQ